MISIDSGNTETLVYNALGEQVREVVPAENLEELWDPFGRIAATYNSTGWRNNGTPYWWPQFMRVDGRIFAYDTCCGNQDMFLHKDALGTTRMVTTAAGAQAEDIVHYPWGDIESLTGGSYDTAFAGFTRASWFSDLMPTLNRQFSPTLGRWMTPDPTGGNILDPQSLNRYAYVENNPATFSDPSGLRECSDVEAWGCEPVDYGLGGGGDGGWEVGPYDGAGFCPPGFVSCGSGGAWDIGFAIDFGIGTVLSGGGGGGATASGAMGNTAFPVKCTIHSTPQGEVITCGTISVTVKANSPIATILAAIKWLLSRPWEFSWTIPLLGEAGVAGVGPAGGFYYDPATHDFCGSAGLGAAGGHSATIGPITNAWTPGAVPATPAQTDNIAKGWSWSVGGNAPSPGSAIGLGLQISGNGSGVFLNPNIGLKGAGLSATYGFCTE